jgi:fructose-1,6-bisphosphatase I
MIKGGIYLYPTSSKAPKGNCVCYECNPLAFITEQAGGKADGFNRIMIEPTNCMKVCRSFAEVTTWLKKQKNSCTKAKLSKY